jgi:hypothetical protein
MSGLSFARGRGVLAATLILALGFAFVGCGGSGKATVTGKVAYKGKTVRSGVLTMLAADNRMVSSQIDAEGRYTIDEVAAGEVLVGVASPDPGAAPAKGRSGRGEMKGTALKRPAPDPKWFPIPEKFEHPDTSGLRYKIQRGANELNIDLP